MKTPQICGEKRGFDMKNKIFFIFIVTAISFLVGGVFESQQADIAYAQIKSLDAKTEKKRNITDEPILEEKNVALPTKTPVVNPETFRMFETIEKKNRELKRREEELRINELRIKEIEAKVSKDLEKIEKGITESKQQLGMYDEKTKENVQSLIKVYSSMKPEEAAGLIEVINDDLALKIIAGMKSKIAGKVLSKLDVKVAKRISETLAGKKMKDDKMMKDNKMMKSADKQ
jgi:flagellar motility protein MotE (MotC chaperone)